MASCHAAIQTSFGSLGNSQPTGQPSNTPNILLILADDVGTGDIPTWWNNTSLVSMPNIERLIRQGLKFTDAHSTPLCATSRYMLLSGNYQHRGKRPRGSWDVRKSGNQFQSYQVSIAKHLRDEAGYNTGIFGKWHLGTKSRQKEFNSTHILSENVWMKKLKQGPGDLGFNTSFISLGGIQAPPYAFYHNDHLTTNSTNVVYWKEGRYPMPHGISKIYMNEGEGDADWDSSAYNMILVNETIKFVDKHLEANNGSPFFAYVALGSVHIPHSPPNLYLDGSPIAHQYQTRHLDMLHELDKVVGSLIQMIEERNLAEDTLIIFTSDNGGLRYSEKYGHHTSGPLRDIKASIYEGGHRVPLVMRYDNIFPRGESRDHVVGLNDVYATLSDLAGIQSIPYGSAQDSVSFAKYAISANNTSSLRTEIAHWEYRSGRLPIEAIRFGNYKLIHFPVNSTFALYNLQDDLSERNNLSHDPEYADMIHTMYTRLQELGPCPQSDVAKSRSFRMEPGNGRKRKCPWFAKNNRKRCRKFPQAIQWCAATCSDKKWCNRNFPHQ
jgi:arylsulfatase A-like enzyme